MRCDDVRDALGVPEPALARTIASHLAGCQPCAELARRVQALDSILTSGLVVAPPAALEARLLAAVDAELAARPVVTTESLAWADGALWATLVAAVLAVAAGWQALLLMAGSALVLGDPVEALALVGASPVAALGAAILPPLDVNGLLIWAAVALAGWAIADHGTPIAERAAEPAARRG